MDRLRAGAVGIFSGKMSYFCSRECRDRFSSSGKGSHGDRAASPVPFPVTRATGPGRPVSSAPASPVADPALPGVEPMLPLLERDVTREPVRERAEDLAVVAPPTSPVGVLEQGYVPAVAHGPEGRPQTGRWLVCAVVGGAALLAVHLLLGWGKLEPTRLLALAVIVPGLALGILNVLLEWKASSLARAADDLVVVCAVLLYALPSWVLMFRGDEVPLQDVALAPVAVLVAVWAARAIEAFLSGLVDRMSAVGPVHAPETVRGLFTIPSRFGRSRAVRVSRTLATILRVGCLPAGLVVVAVAWLVTGRLGVATNWSMAAAVTLSLAPRLVSNVVPPVLVASLVAARQAGLLFSDDLQFEKAGDVDTLVLRKRGVLVEPTSEVLHYHHVGALPRETVLALLSSCEQIASLSEPATALIRFVKKEGIRPGDTRLTRWFASRGVQSTSPFGEIFVGNRLFLIENGISVGKGEDVAQDAEKKGNTAIFVSVDRSMEGVIVLANRLKSSARAAVQRSRHLGLTSILVTGDSFRTAESIGHELGVDQIRPEIAVGSREQELDRVRGTGARLAVLGNVAVGPDASADERDVNLALGWDGESPVDARWSATVAGEDLSRAVDALQVARRARTLMRINWTLAVAGGGLALGLSASGLASPVMAALAVNLVAASMMAVRPSLLDRRP